MLGIRIGVTLCIVFSFNILFAQSSYWKPSSHKYANQTLTRNVETYTAFTLALETFQEMMPSAADAPIEIELPGAEGQLESFKIWEASIMQSGLAAKYPHIKTYLIQNINRPSIHGRLSITSNGLKAFISSPEEPYFIYPAEQNHKTYAVFKKSDLIQNHDFRCAHNEQDFIAPQITERSSSQIGDVLSTYRLAVSTTGEYSSYHGGNLTSVLEAIVETVNQVNVVYETDFSVRFMLIDRTDELINLDQYKDPFDNSDAGQMLTSNSAFINARIDASSYDIGHVFATGGAGLASLSSVCRNNKAQATTGIFPPEGSSFAIDYVAHEFGHQMGSLHTFNNCGGQESPSVAYEPGSGSTIMAYAGLCGPNNVQFTSDNYFHVSSLIQISDNIDGSGGSCPEETDHGNNIPTVEAGTGGFSIPIGTPFMLTAQGGDADEDNELTYCWEQYTTGPQSEYGSPQGNAPSFRSFKPNVKPTRIFPKLSTIISGNSNKSEVLPEASRDFTFQCTVRDNNPGGGAVAWDDISFEATDQAGPFIVTSQNEDGIVWQTNNPATVTWDVADTDQAPINCQKVNIIMSKNLGISFDIMLAANVDNDGSATFIVPDEAKSNFAYVQVVAADNIFFNVNRRKFKVEEGVVSTQNLAFEQSVNVYPNPSDGRVTLHMNDFASKDAILQVMDVQGRVLEQHNIAQQKQDIDLDVAPGLYFFKISQDDKVAYKKVIISK